MPVSGSSQRLGSVRSAHGRWILPRDPTRLRSYPTRLRSYVGMPGRRLGRCASYAEHIHSRVSLALMPASLSHQSLQVRPFRLPCVPRCCHLRPSSLLLRPRPSDTTQSRRCCTTLTNGVAAVTVDAAGPATVAEPAEKASASRREVCMCCNTGSKSLAVFNARV